MSFFVVISILQRLTSFVRSKLNSNSRYRNDTSTGSMRSFFLLASYISLALRAGAYVLPVIDAANLQQQVQNEYQNLTQYLSTVSNTLKSAQQLEQQVLQLGQYANINNLAGVGTIGQIVRESEGIYSPRNWDLWSDPGAY